MEKEKEKTKSYNDQENSQTKEDKKKQLISLDDADFSNKAQVINSPRSLEACLHLGIEPNELYILTMDEFKQKYPEVRSLNQELLKYRYDAEEKFRKETLEQVKEERNKIIEKENKKKEE